MVRSTSISAGVAAMSAVLLLRLEFAAGAQGMRSATVGATGLGGSGRGVTLTRRRCGERASSAGLTSSGLG